MQIKTNFFTYSCIGNKGCGRTKMFSLQYCHKQRIILKKSQISKCFTLIQKGFEEDAINYWPILITSVLSKNAESS